MTDAKPLALSADQILAICREGLPLVRQLNPLIDRLEGGLVTLRLPYRPESLRPGNTISGPTLMALADMAMYVLVLHRIPDAIMAVTANMTINFLRRPKPGDLLAQGRMLKLGRRLAVIEVTIHPADSLEPVAHVTGSYALPGAEGRVS